MCCSVSPGVAVRFSGTVLYGAEVEVRGETVHVLGYQNKVQNRAGEPSVAPSFSRWISGWFSSREPAGPGNAMILPFPAVPQTMTEANVLDTRKCPDILQDMAAAVAPPRSYSRGLSGIVAGAAAPRVQVFASGIYTVVLAQDARDIPAALDQVPEAKRPALNPPLFEAYAKWYPDWTVALCCFNNRDERWASPMLWWYRPMLPEQLFLPALDCHTGDIPDLKAEVKVDHLLVVGSRRRTSYAAPVKYRNKIPPEVAPYLLSEVIGRPAYGSMPNGDFIGQWADVRNEVVFQPDRRPPPGRHEPPATA